MQGKLSSAPPSGGSCLDGANGKTPHFGQHTLDVAVCGCQRPPRDRVKVIEIYRLIMRSLGKRQQRTGGGNTAIQRIKRFHGGKGRLEAGGVHERTHIDEIPDCPTIRKQIRFHAEQLGERGYPETVYFDCIERLSPSELPQSNFIAVERPKDQHRPANPRNREVAHAEQGVLDVVEPLRQQR